MKPAAVYAAETGQPALRLFVVCLMFKLPSFAAPAAFFLSLVGALGVWSAQTQPQPAGVQAATVQTVAPIAWQASFETALQTARRDNKPLMLDFYTDWCVACKAQDETYRVPEVAREAAQFVSVRVNAEKRLDLAQRFGVHEYPTLLWLSPDGQILDRESGAFRSDDFAAYLRGVRAKFAGWPTTHAA